MPIYKERAPSEVEWERRQAVAKADDDKRRQVARERHEQYLKETAQANKRLNAQRAEQRKRREKALVQQKKDEGAAKVLANRLEREQSVRDMAQRILDGRSLEGESDIRVPGVSAADVRR